LSLKIVSVKEDASELRTFCPIPTMTPVWRGLPTKEGNTALGASSPAKPAFTIPEPLSHTKALTSPSSAISAHCNILTF
jgi:hypothetical protein